jgi:hypothetical protein
LTLEAGYVAWQALGFFRVCDPYMTVILTYMQVLFVLLSKLGAGFLARWILETASHGFNPVRRS